MMTMTTKPDNEAVTHAFTAAAEAASLAPSIHNSQPWHWRIGHGAADLYVDPRRHLQVNDPDRRMLVISCGAALHHAQVALAAEGLAVDCTLMPEAGDANHLAHLRITATTGVTTAAVRLMQTLEIRHTDRRPLLEQPLPDGSIDALRSAVTQFGIGLDPLDRDQMIKLASATARAQRDQINDEAARAELDAWSGRGRPPFAGVPDTNIPNRDPQTTVPARDFGHVGTLGVSEGHDNAATYAILYGMDDEPSSWLRAGEALSALWLRATELGIAVLPLSAAAEEPTTRQWLRQILSGVGYPYIAVRLGIPDASQSAPERTPRLKPQVTIEIVD
jgi:nitroreductase